MQANYEKCLARSLRWEGDFSNHPRDPGGATMQGVTQRVYNGWRQRQGRAPQSVRHMTEAEKRDIYRALYADKIAFDALPTGIDCVVLDAAINSGPARAAQWLQRALGVVVDGNSGPATIFATGKQYMRSRVIIERIMELRRNFLRHLSTFDVFGDGWLNRCKDIERFALSLVAGENDSAHDIPAERTPPAIIEDARPRPSQKAGDAAIGGGVATGVIVTTINQTKDALEPLAGGGKWIDGLIAALAVLSAVLVIGGLLWSRRQKQRARDRADALDLPHQVTA